MNYIESPVERRPATTYVDRFLAARNEADSFVLVEFGHYDAPIAFIQPVPFTGGRAAIGIETWFYDPKGVARSIIRTKREEDSLGQNIFFLEHDLGGHVPYKNLKYGKYQGAYEPGTILPDGAAEEVVASNLFGDEQLAADRARTTKMLAEMTRLAALPGGHVVRRETATPRANPFLNQELFARFGLILEATIVPDDAVEWEKLEAVYNGETAHNGMQPDSFYQILRKIEKGFEPDSAPQKHRLTIQGRADKKLESV